MPTFTTRVELNGDPSAEVYNDLYIAMHRRGFSRFIKSSDGEIYHMPNAEYNRKDDCTASQVLDDAKAAAGSVWNDFQVLVTQGARNWHNLRIAHPVAIQAEMALA
jgi:hypothetical protein